MIFVLYKIENYIFYKYDILLKIFEHKDIK